MNDYQRQLGKIYVILKGNPYGFLRAAAGLRQITIFKGLLPKPESRKR